MRPLGTALALCLTLPLAACGGEAPNAAKDAETLLARAGGSVLAVDTGDGDVKRLPAGAHDRAWRAIYTAEAGSTETTVTATDPATGLKLRETTLPGRWQIPVAAGRTPEGAVSGDDRWLILAGSPSDEASEFSLLDTAMKAPPRRFRLPGHYEFDALAPDGSAVFLSQVEPDGRYTVRAFDLSSGELRPKVIVEKTSVGTIMQGVPVAREVDPTGSPVHTLYRGGPVGAFIHSLNTRDGSALCILIPRSRKAGPDWQLRLDETIDELHATNAQLGAHYLVNPRAGDVSEAPPNTPLPGTSLARYAVRDGAITAGPKTIAKVGGEAELLAVR